MKMTSGALFGAIVGALCLAQPQAAGAQVAASLPDRNAVERGEASSADGTYVVSTINKRITIEEGRGYVVDPWTQALIFRIKPGMVTLRNFRQTGPDKFEADDLPMMGKVVFNRQPNGTLQGVVAGAFGEAKYALVPTEYVSLPGGSADNGAGDGSGGIGAPPPDRIYRLHVSAAQCTGSNLLRKHYGGVLRIAIKDPNGNRLTSKNRNFAVACTKKGQRSQSYNFYNSGPGALTLTVPANAGNFREMRVLGDNKKQKNFSINRAHSSLLTNSINSPSALGVGQKQDDVVEVYGKKAKLSVKFTLERIQ